MTYKIRGNRYIADSFLLFCLKGVEFLKSLQLGLVFRIASISQMSLEKQHKILAEMADVLIYIFFCHLSLKTNMVAMRMRVEHSFYAVQQG